MNLPAIMFLRIVKLIDKFTKNVVKKLWKNFCKATMGQYLCTVRQLQERHTPCSAINKMED